MKTFVSCVLIAGGLATLCYCCAWLGDAWIAQHQGERQLQRRLREADTGEKTEKGGVIGRIEIARLGLSSIILEGSGETTLRRGIGHISGTALPGQPGNVGLADHRDTFFRALRNVRQDDAIVLRMPRGNYRYHVVATSTVSPSAVEVLRPGSEASVTLVTCYPFYFVGAAPKRFIVRAVKDSASLRGPDEPAPDYPH